MSVCSSTSASSPCRCSSARHSERNAAPPTGRGCTTCGANGERPGRGGRRPQPASTAGQSVSWISSASSSAWRLSRIHEATAASSSSRRSTISWRRLSSRSRSPHRSPDVRRVTKYGSSLSHRGDGGSDPSERACTRTSVPRTVCESRGRRADPVMCAEELGVRMLPAGCAKDPVSGWAARTDGPAARLDARSLHSAPSGQASTIGHPRPANLRRIAGRGRAAAMWQGGVRSRGRSREGAR